MDSTFHKLARLVQTLGEGEKRKGLLGLKDSTRRMTERM